MTTDTTPAPKFGTMILPSAKQYFMTVHVGRAESDDTPEKSVVLEHGMNGSMHVRSELTGKRFVVSWNEVIEAAIDAGLLTPEEA